MLNEGQNSPVIFPNHSDVDVRIDNRPDEEQVDEEHIDEELFNCDGGRKRQRTSYVWQNVRQFDPNRDEDSFEGKSQCRVCLKWYSSRINASGWKRHLLKHQIIDPADVFTATSSGTASATMMQSSLRRKPGPKDLVLLHDAVVEYVIMSMSPHVAVERMPMAVMLDKFRSGYVPLSARTVGRRILELFMIMTPILTCFMQSLPHRFAIAIDGWSNAHLRGFYMTTVHWIDISTGTLRCMLLYIFRPDPGTGVSRRLANMVFEFFKSMGDSVLNKLQAVVTDNGSDAIAASKLILDKLNCHFGLEILNEDWIIRCFDHSIQLGVKEALKFINQINDNLRTILMKIRQGKVKRLQYRREAKARNASRLEPPHVDSKTRWGSTYDMVRESYEARKIIDHVVELHAEEMQALSTSEWIRIGTIASFLKSVRSIMDEAGSSLSPTISLVDAQLGILIAHCNETASSTNQELLKLAANAMHDKISEYQYKLTGLPTIAVFLDPRFPKPDDPEDRLAMKNEIRGFAKLHELFLQSYCISLRYLFLKYDYVIPQKNGRNRSSQCCIHYKSLFRRSRSTSTTRSPMDEVDFFSNMFEPEETNLLDFWMKHQKVFPVLFQLAMDVLCVPASSTAVERVNSEAGQEYSSDRLSLSPFMFMASM